MTAYAEVPATIVETVGSICTALPDVYEEQAWVGTRWLVRKRTFAHVLAVVDGSPPAYARAAKCGESIIVLTFRSTGDELLAIRNAGHPFFYGGWGRDVVGMVVDANVDWTEVRELLIESYCVMAPKKLVALVNRPTDDSSTSLAEE